MLKAPPAAICAAGCSSGADQGPTLLGSTTSTAAWRSTNVPSPSAPSLFRPHAYTDQLSARPDSLPAAIMVTFVRLPPLAFCTCTGAELSVVELFPSWPALLR